MNMAVALTGFYVGIASGEYVPIKKWPSSYTLGGGGNFIAGYQLDSRWALQLDTSMWLLSGSGLDTWDFKGILAVKRDLGASSVRPFVMAGVGLDEQLSQPQSTWTSRAVLTLGLGLQVELRPGCRVFVEGIGYLVLGSVATQDLPIVAGMTVVF